MRNQENGQLVIPRDFTGARKYGDLREMTDEDFKNVYDEIYLIVQDAVYRQGYFAAGAFILQVTNSGKVGLAFPANFAVLFKEKGSEGKVIATKYMNHMIDYPAVDFAVFVSECWQSPSDGLRPSQHPERKEVIMINLIGKNKQAIATCPVYRNSKLNKIRIKEKGELTFVSPEAIEGVDYAVGRFIRDKRAIN